MKRTIPLILAFILCLSILSGCSDVKYKGPLSCVSHVGVDGVTALMDMTEDAQAEIISALNSGEWGDGGTNCGHDYEFTIDNATIRYHSDCGSFNDITNKRAMTLSEEGKANINKILGVKTNSNEGNNGSTDDDGDDLTESGYQAAIKMMRFNWDGYGISTKWIATCDLAYSIIDAVEELTETGEVIEKISDAVVDENTTQPPIEPGTLWFEVGSKIYRIDPEFTQICRVDGHLGKGYVMNASEQLKKMISDAWQYHPYDYYTGSYNNETNEIELNHVYDAPSTVHVHIKKVEVINDYDPANKIILELTSTVDQSVYISLFCSQSGDNLAEGDSKDLTLQAGKPETVELTFGGWKDFNYWIDIKVDNTRINLRIEP